MKQLINCVLQKQQLRRTRSFLQAELQMETDQRTTLTTLLFSNDAKKNGDNQNNQNLIVSLKKLVCVLLEIGRRGRRGINEKKE